MLHPNRFRGAARCAVLALLLGGAPAGQIIVGDGGDLVAAVAGAADGSVIEIQSDRTFLGTLAWSGKELTLRAGAGFTPTVKGNPDQPALQVFGAAPLGGATLEGLALEAGDPTGLGPEYAIWINETTPGPALVRLTVTDCTLAGRLNIQAQGQLQVDATVTGTTVLDHARFTLGPTAGGDFAMLDCTLARSLLVQAAAGTVGSFELRRTEVPEGLMVQEAPTATLDTLVESCLFVSDQGTGDGISHLDVGLGTAQYVNCTVGGFFWGIKANEGQILWDNMVVFGNSDDVSPGIPFTALSTSMIEDGTYAGLGGNFQGTPLFDADYALLPGSPGIDAGSPALGNLLGPTDRAGKARVVDGDGDTVSRVDVGALETQVCPGAAPATQVVRLGTPPNPNALLPGSIGPVLGTTWDPRVDHTTFQPFASIDFLGVTALPANLPLGGVFLGTLLCDVASFPPYVYATFAGLPFAVAIPGDCNLVGVSLCAQAASQSGGVFALTNALDISLGG